MWLILFLVGLIIIGVLLRWLVFSRKKGEPAEARIKLYRSHWQEKWRKRTNR